MSPNSNQQAELARQLDLNLDRVYRWFWYMREKVRKRYDLSEESINILTNGVHQGNGLNHLQGIISQNFGQNSVSNTGGSSEALNTGGGLKIESDEMDEFFEEPITNGERIAQAKLESKKLNGVLLERLDSSSSSPFLNQQNHQNEQNRQIDNISNQTFDFTTSQAAAALLNISQANNFKLNSSYELLQRLAQTADNSDEPEDQFKIEVKTEREFSSESKKTPELKSSPEFRKSPEWKNTPESKTSFGHKVAQHLNSSDSMDVVLVFGGQREIGEITKSRIIQLENMVFGGELKLRVAPAWQKDSLTGEVKLSNINQLNLGKISPGSVKNVIVDMGSFPVQSKYNLFNNLNQSTRNTTNSDSIDPVKLHEFYNKCEDGTRLIHDWLTSIKRRFENLESIVEISDDESCLPLKTVLYVIAQDTSLNLNLLPQTNSKRLYRLHDSKIPWFSNKVQNACIHIQHSKPENDNYNSSDDRNASTFFSKQLSSSPILPTVDMTNAVIDFSSDAS